MSKKGNVGYPLRPEDCIEYYDHQKALDAVQRHIFAQIDYRAVDAKVCISLNSYARYHSKEAPLATVDKMKPMQEAFNQQMANVFSKIPGNSI